VKVRAKYISVTISELDILKVPRHPSLSLSLFLTLSLSLPLSLSLSLSFFIPLSTLSLSLTGEERELQKVWA
jgi:hypothetical protein